MLRHIFSQTNKKGKTRDIMVLFIDHGIIYVPFGIFSTYFFLNLAETFDYEKHNTVIN